MHDAIVIGGSFAGLSAAMQLARARRRICVIDAGAPRNRFAAASHGFFGQDGMAPAQMIGQAREKVLAYPSVQFVEGKAAQVTPRQGSFEVALESGATVAGRKLVLAFGVRDELPAVPGLMERWGQTVLHCPYCHGYEFGDQRLGVLAVSAMSVHQALLVADWGPVTLFLNGQEGLLDEMACANLAQRGVVIEAGKVNEVRGQVGGVMQLALAGGGVREIDALFVAPRAHMNSPIAAQLGCEFEDSPFGPIIKTDFMKRTSVPGVFAAGDIARMAPNATFASADGVMAGGAAHQALVFEPLQH